MNKKITIERGIYYAITFIFITVFATRIVADSGIATGTISLRNLTTASSGQQASFQALQQICTNSKADASLACSLTGGGVFPNPAPGNSLQLQQFSPQAAIQAETIAITSPYQFIRNVNQQIRRISECNPAQRSKELDKMRDFECNDQQKTGGGSSYDAYSFIGPFGVSLSGGGGFGDRENSVGQTGFNIDTRQANLFIDYSINKELTAGFSFGYLNSNRKMGLASGNLNSDSYRFAPFLSYTPTPESYITLTGGYALVDFDSTRRVTPVANINKFGDVITIKFSDAAAKYSANQFFASLGGGYTHRMGAWSLRGYGRADYQHSSVSRFQESGGNAGEFSYANSVGSQSVLSATTTLGAEISYAISTSTLAAVIIPNLHAEWVHEFKNNGRQAQTVFSAKKLDGSSLFNSAALINVAGPERNWANLGFGIQMLFPHAIVGYVNYDTLFVENASNQTVSGGFRINF